MSELVRFAEASAALEADPHLHHEWATCGDRATRRALMRSPELPPEVAEAIVETRRSGMHTLGSNPRTPPELLESNPGARRRRQQVLDAAPGGLAEIEAHPNRTRYVAIGSPTVDLVVARAPALTRRTARALASRTDPVADPWVLARLVARFGEPLQELVDEQASSARRSAVRSLVDGARSLG